MEIKIKNNTLSYELTENEQTQLLMFCSFHGGCKEGYDFIKEEAFVGYHRFFFDSFEDKEAQKITDFVQFYLWLLEEFPIPNLKFIRFAPEDGYNFLFHHLSNMMKVCPPNRLMRLIRADNKKQVKKLFKFP